MIPSKLYNIMSRMKRAVHSNKNAYASVHISIYVAIDQTHCTYIENIIYLYTFSNYQTK